MNLAGKTAIITGASAGIGAACARDFVREGARVVLAARSPGPLQKVVDELGADKAKAIPTDVSSVEGCKALVQGAIDAFGSVDVLVNNAGFNSRGTLDGVAPEALLQIVDVNLKAPILLSRLVVPHLRAQNSGAIINVASLAGRVPLDDEATYSATKFGLRAFSFALAEEFHETGVTVSVVSPGPVETGFIMEEIESVPALVFSQPMSTAEEISALVIACAKDGKRERVKPAVGARLATLAYLFPSLRRLLRPALEKKGLREKEKYRQVLASRTAS